MLILFLALIYAGSNIEDAIYGNLRHSSLSERRGVTKNIWKLQHLTYFFEICDDEKIGFLFICAHSFMYSGKDGHEKCKSMASQGMPWGLQEHNMFINQCNNTT